jgi:hypothetical protein
MKYLWGFEFLRFLHFDQNTLSGQPVEPLGLVEQSQFSFLVFEFLHMEALYEN